MLKTKYIVAIGITTAAVGISGASWFAWRGHTKSYVRQQSTDVAGASTDMSLTQTTDSNSISLNRPQAQPSASSGLSVAPVSGANNLGQINPSGDKTSSPTNASGARSSNPSPVDPTTFKQYEKYKDGESALFGELQVGTGAELTANKKAAVYYKGWLTDGKLFDMSRPDKGGKLQPFIFTMGAHQVIPGWEQALAGMKVGGTRLLIVPPSVGYGATGQPPIPGNAVLVFQVQLLEVQ